MVAAGIAGEHIEDDGLGLQIGIADAGVEDVYGGDVGRVWAQIVDQRDLSYVADFHDDLTHLE